MLLHTLLSELSATSYHGFYVDFVQLGLKNLRLANCNAPRPVLLKIRHSIQENYSYLRFGCANQDQTHGTGFVSL